MLCAHTRTYTEPDRRAVSECRRCIFHNYSCSTICNCLVRSDCETQCHTYCLRRHECILMEEARKRNTNGHRNVLRNVIMLANKLRVTPTDKIHCDLLHMNTLRQYIIFPHIYRIASNDLWCTLCVQNYYEERQLPFDKSHVNSVTVRFRKHCIMCTREPRKKNITHFVLALTVHVVSLMYSVYYYIYSVCRSALYSGTPAYAVRFWSTSCVSAFGLAFIRNATNGTWPWSTSFIPRAFRLCVYVLYT